MASRKTPRSKEDELTAKIAVLENYIYSMDGDHSDRINKLRKDVDALLHTSDAS